MATTDALHPTLEHDSDTSTLPLRPSHRGGFTDLASLKQGSRSVRHDTLPCPITTEEEVDMQDAAFWQELERMQQTLTKQGRATGQISDIVRSVIRQHKILVATSHGQICSSDTADYQPRLPCDSPQQQIVRERGVRHSQTALIDAPKLDRETELALSKHSRSRVCPARSQRRLDHKRLSTGAQDLGPYTYEQQMPSRMLAKLARQPRTRLWTTINATGHAVTCMVYDNQTPGLIDVIARVLPNTVNSSLAYLCHPAVKHVHNMPKGGPFCGYFNIQMLMSHLMALDHNNRVNADLSQHPLPGILELQEMIEGAWDRGFCEYGRRETGGIRGTRKWIGTPEVEALFESLGYRCRCTMFRPTRRNTKPAYEQLLDHVERYFDSGRRRVEGMITHTQRAPIYLQQPGHSMTIVGLEVDTSGRRSLLVFNPSNGPSPEMQKLLCGGAGAASQMAPEAIQQSLRAYRRRPDQLANHTDFETIEVQLRE